MEQSVWFSSAPQAAQHRLQIDLVVAMVVAVLMLFVVLQNSDQSTNFCLIFLFVRFIFFLPWKRHFCSCCHSQVTAVFLVFFFKYNFHISLSVSVIRYLLLKYAHTQKKLDALGASVHFLKVRTSLENLGSVLVDLLGNEDLFGVFLDHGLENQGKKGQ